MRRAVPDIPTDVITEVGLDQAFFWQQSQLSNADLRLSLSCLHWSAAGLKTSLQNAVQQNKPASLGWSHNTGVPTTQVYPHQPADLVQLRGCVRAGTPSRRSKREEGERSDTGKYSLHVVQNDFYCPLRAMDRGRSQTGSVGT